MLLAFWVALAGSDDPASLRSGTPSQDSASVGGRSLLYQRQPQRVRRCGCRRSGRRSQCGREGTGRTGRESSRRRAGGAGRGGGRRGHGRCGGCGRRWRRHIKIELVFMHAHARILPEHAIRLDHLPILRPDACPHHARLARPPPA